MCGILCAWLVRTSQAKHQISQGQTTHCVQSLYTVLAGVHTPIGRLLFCNCPRKSQSDIHPPPGQTEVACTTLSHDDQSQFPRNLNRNLHRPSSQAWNHVSCPSNGGQLRCTVAAGHPHASRQRGATYRARRVQALRGDCVRSSKFPKTDMCRKWGVSRLERQRASLFTATGRSEGSSKFPKTDMCRKWGAFVSKISELPGRYSYSCRFPISDACRFWGI